MIKLIILDHLILIEKGKILYLDCKFKFFELLYDSAI